MSVLKQIKSVFVNGLLLLCLAGLLLAYFFVVTDLPARMYTVTQQKFLAENSRRSLAQAAPTWNVVMADGQIAPAVFPGQSSRVRAALAARYEEQEGVSVTVYDLDFSGEYRLSHSGPLSTTVGLFFPFPDNLETLHQVRFLVDGQEPADVQYSTRGISWQTLLEAGEEHQIVISYHADGANSFSYGLQHNQRADVDMVVTVAGLTGSQVAKNSLPPSTNELGQDGENWTWHYDALIADRDIQLNLPARLSFTQRVARLQADFRTLGALAPLLTGLFLASLAGAFSLGGIHLRLESYLLVGCGMALFYPLLTFFSGVIDLIPAAAAALLLIAGLLIAFLGLLVGWRQSIWRVGLLLVIFLGFFSLGMLTPWRGLLLAGGGLLLVATFMLLYVRRPAPVVVEPIWTPPETEPPEEELSKEEQAEPQLESQPVPQPAQPHCPYCARPLADDYAFCPGCGHDTRHIRHCACCGHRQFIPPDLGKGAPAKIYCVQCGTPFEKEE